MIRRFLKVSPHDQGLLGAVYQYWNIGNKSTILNRKNTYFEDLVDEIASSPKTIRFFIAISILAIAMVSSWSVGL